MQFLGILAQGRIVLLDKIPANLIFRYTGVALSCCGWIGISSAEGVCLVAAQGAGGATTSDAVGCLSLKLVIIGLLRGIIAVDGIGRHFRGHPH